jgi:LytR cell envelope-related transcriptional attenuator
MSQDFFADLERQLVDATAQRRSRIRRARARRAAALSAVLVALLAAGGGLAAAVTGGDAGGARHGTPAGRPAAPAGTTPLSPRTRDLLARQTVAVLNATTAPGLARGVANRLQNAGVRIGTVTNAATQDRPSTCVLYAPGHEQAARRVAAVLDLPPDAVIGAAAAADRAVAGPGATVVVLVGADQDTSPSP